MSEQQEAALQSVSASIYKLAWKWSLSIPECNRGWVNHEDLHSLGMAKAFQCLEKYDPNCGTKLSTFILGCVRNTFSDYVGSLRMTSRMATTASVDALTDDESPIFQLPAPSEVPHLSEATELKLNQALERLAYEPGALALLELCMSGKRIGNSVDLTSKPVATLRGILTDVGLTLEEFRQLRSIACITTA